MLGGEKSLMRRVFFLASELELDVQSSNYKG